MQKFVLEQQLQAQDFNYKTFHQNLAEKLDHQEINSLNVLGRDFFKLIDHIVSEIFTTRAGDCFLLELSLQEYLWELQIFTNQFIRREASSILKLRHFSEKCLIQFQNEDFYDSFMKKVYEEYTNHFFTQDSNNAYLV
ncbi:MAG: hypothetical protein HQM13_10540 [SAR324 cluster bacterium]|nr:hypothetical protein [SAR324 cluster bacterium]